MEDVYDPMVIEGSPASSGWWAGQSSADAFALYKNIRDFGVLKKAHYIVYFRVFSDDYSRIFGAEIFQDANLTYLATSTSLPLIDAETESTKAGHFQHNYVTGQSVSDFQITMIETEKADIANSIQIIKDAMFKPDGTQGLPAEYMFYVTIELFRPYDIANRPLKKNFLVSLQSASIELDASSSSPIEIPMTFTRMFPFE
ncbi:MAG: hypothetical protein RLY58_1300 [Pseudomonadota bacterium]|jgi:hypothetical protein